LGSENLKTNKDISRMREHQAAKIYSMKDSSLIAAFLLIQIPLSR